MANRRTRELRAAAMSMPLSEAARAALEEGLASAHRGEIRPWSPAPPARERRLEEPRAPRRYDCGHPRPKSVELKGWYHACVACARFERRKTRHWLLVGLAAFVLLVVTCTARASDPCAPYTPADGRTCQPPTRLTWIHKKLNPVCTCWPPRVARSAL